MKIAATKREPTKASQLGKIRKEGSIPAVVYGPKTDPQPVTVNAKEFTSALAGAGESSLLDFSLDGGDSSKVLIKDVQRDPVSDQPVHVDFFQVDMTKPLEVEVILDFEGDAPAVKILGGILNRQVKELEVRCLPADLVHSIKVDLSSLATFEDTIRIKDLNIPKGMEPLGDENDVVAMVSEPISEEELAALEETPEAEEPAEGKEGEEAEGEKKEGEDAPAEGEEGKKEESEPKK